MPQKSDIEKLRKVAREARARRGKCKMNDRNGIEVQARRELFALLKLAETNETFAGRCYMFLELASLLSDMHHLRLAETVLAEVKRALLAALKANPHEAPLWQVYDDMIDVFDHCNLLHDAMEGAQTLVSILDEIRGDDFTQEERELMQLWQDMHSFEVVSDEEGTYGVPIISNIELTNEQKQWCASRYADWGRAEFAEIVREKLKLLMQKEHDRKALEEAVTNVLRQGISGP